MEKLFLIIIFTLFLNIRNACAQETETYDVPDLPSLDLSEVDNELNEFEQKSRGPSNSPENTIDQYKQPESAVKPWDYQNIIDRHDKH